MTAARSTIDIRKAEPWDGLDVATALSEAFFDDPIVEWILPDRAQRRAVSVPMFSLFAEAFLPYGEVRVTGDGIGAALWLPPGAELSESETEAFGGAVAEVLGPDAERAFELMAVMEEHHPHEPCYYLQLVGVVPEHQGRGLGAALMQPVLAQCDREGVPAYLEATTRASLRLYERLGFEVIGEFAPAGGPPLWPMWRRPAR